MPKAKPKPKAPAPKATPKPVENHIKVLKPLAQNPRAHTPRNIGMIVTSLQEVGAARSIVIDENNEVLAGNGTLEAAGEAGITKLKIIEADGETIIAVRRSGLTPDQKARLAVQDNRANETSGWDSEVMKSLHDAGMKTDDLFNESEWKNLFDRPMAAPQPPGAFPKHDEDDQTKYRCPKCEYEWKGKAK